MDSAIFRRNTRSSSFKRISGPHKQKKSHVASHSTQSKQITLNLKGGKHRKRRTHRK